MTRHVAVVTSSRADFGHLHWPLVRLRECVSLRVSLIAVGAHLAPRFGTTLSAIADAGFDIDATVECLIGSDTGVGMAKTIGTATLGIADAFARLQPDLLLLPADRYEMLAVASAALAMGIPIAHLEGGDVSEGAIDDAVRNALTKMSHIHLTPTEQARRRVLAMGEEAWRVHRVGAPSLDHLRERAPLDDDELVRRLALTPAPDMVLVAFHPVTLTQTTAREADALYSVLEQLSRQTVFCFPNADAGSHGLIERARRFCATHADAHLFVNLDHWTYWNVLRRASVMIGNSSSGIMEAPSLRIPVIDIGERQRGRERAANIVHAAAEPQALHAALRRVREPDFVAGLREVSNPYGDGRAAGRIVRILRDAPARDVLLRKRALPLVNEAYAFDHRVPGH